MLKVKKFFASYFAFFPSGVHLAEAGHECRALNCIDGASFLTIFVKHMQNFVNF